VTEERLIRPDHQNDIVNRPPGDAYVVTLAERFIRRILVEAVAF
jgi:hypothetical protein